MTTAVVDSTQNEQGLAGWLLDTAVVVRPQRRPERRGCRWVRDPVGEQGLVCIWD